MPPRPKLLRKKLQCHRDIFVRLPFLLICRARRTALFLVKWSSRDFSRCLRYSMSNLRRISDSRFPPIDAPRSTVVHSISRSLPRFPFRDKRDARVGALSRPKAPRGFPGEASHPPIPVESCLYKSYLQSNKITIIILIIIINLLISKQKSVFRFRWKFVLGDFRGRWSLKMEK